MSGSKAVSHAGKREVTVVRRVCKCELGDRRRELWLLVPAFSQPMSLPDSLVLQGAGVGRSVPGYDSAASSCVIWTFMETP